MIPLADQQNITYFKRFKMEVELREDLCVPPLVEGYHWIAWEDTQRDAHAEVMFRSFSGEIDGLIFPSLGDHRGSSILMHEIRNKSGFLPQATWLLASAAGCCGCVQGLHDRSGLGAIQNLAVLPGHRGRGLGSALLLQALRGFRSVGLVRAWLEVTAQNEGAVRLYQRLGFRRRKTLYKAVELPPHVPVPYPLARLPCPLSNA